MQTTAFYVIIIKVLLVVEFPKQRLEVAVVPRKHVLVKHLLNAFKTVLLVTHTEIRGYLIDLL